MVKLLVGSTPRMRGISYRRFLCYIRDRFNPAYAGNISPHSYRVCDSQVQPRVCGEYLSAPCEAMPYKGSTPRMRGIYPQRHPKSYSNKVQPRVCGEYYMNNLTLNAVVGSTPRMRGIFCRTLSAILLIRFNPAYAGNIQSFVVKLSHQ